jgi:hypothetical protein
MGHSRLGAIPKTKKWAEVVRLVAGVDGSSNGVGIADDVQRIAQQALNAAQAGLRHAVNDEGMAFTFYMLTQIVLAAREPDWLDRLGTLGINLSANASLFDLTAEIQAVIDEHTAQRGRSSDISEMAQSAAGQAVGTLSDERANTLFGNTGEELRLAIRQLSTRSGFSRLGQVFFGSFLARYLNFFVSRITAELTASGRAPQLGDLSRFNEALQLHCIQSAKIVHDFSGEWYSKTEFREGITLDSTSRFMSVSLRKLQAELKSQAT